MTVTLTPDQEKFVTDQLRTGQFQSASEVIGQSLEMLRAQEGLIQTHAAEFRDQIAVGLQQAERGELMDGKTAIENLRYKLKQHGRE